LSALPVRTAAVACRDFAASEFWVLST
jgi:hypothetical protein